MCDKKLKVLGALIMGYAQACLNLNIIAGKKITNFLNTIQPTTWYSLTRWTELEKIVLQSYTNADAILMRVGIEMMLAWYNFGPGKKIINNGIDFLHFQTSSEGYASVVEGSADQVGNFELKTVNPEKGKAIVQSTTPFNRKMECGVLIGGMKAPGDLDYIDVINDNTQPDIIKIEFH